MLTTEKSEGADKRDKPFLFRVGLLARASAKERIFLITLSLA
jgi:hypothetical protein